MDKLIRNWGVLPALVAALGVGALIGLAASWLLVFALGEVWTVRL